MRIRDFLPATSLVAVCVLWLAFATLRPQPGQSQIGVVFPPNYSGQDVLTLIEPSPLAYAVGAGYVEVDEDCLKATAEGRLRLNGLLASLLVK